MDYHISHLRKFRVVLGANLVELREAKNLDVEQFCNLTGFSTQLINQLEKGKNFIHIDTLFKLACFHDVSVSRLVQGAGPVND